MTAATLYEQLTGRRECASPDCSRTFVSNRSRQKFCSRRCKRWAHDHPRCPRCGGAMARDSSTCRACYEEATLPPAGRAVSQALTVALARDASSRQRAAARTVIRGVGNGSRGGQSRPEFCGFGRLIEAALVHRIDG